MRPGRAEDLTPILDLLRADVRDGRRDAAPADSVVRRMIALEGGANSRVIEGPTRGLEGAILVSVRATPEGPLATMVATVSEPHSAVMAELLRWGLGLSKAVGASFAQLYYARGRGDGLAAVGLKPARAWWRMDRKVANLPEPVAVAGYELQDASRYRAGKWSSAYNRAFADHWRFSPFSEEELITGRPAELCLIATTEAGSPAALALSELQAYAEDQRPQPVGLVIAVGTLPDHRRRGLAAWLVAESLRRLQTAGARHASLYVDGLSQTRAFDVYRKLGFELAYEYEVWEASLR